MMNESAHETRPRATDKCMRGREPVIREDGGIEIPLTQGQVALVDAEDYHLVKGRVWHARWASGTRSFYARTRARRDDGYWIKLFIHRVVIGATDLRVDHKNHDTLDNRRDNLRLADRSQNAHNTRKNVDSASRYKGVRWKKSHCRWMAEINDGSFLPSGWKRQRYLGLFDNEEDAARAYDAAALEAFGEFAFTNQMAGLLT